MGVNYAEIITRPTAAEQAEVRRAYLRRRHAYLSYAPLGSASNPYAAPPGGRQTGRKPASGQRVNWAAILARYDVMRQEMPGLSMTEICKAIGAASGVHHKTIAAKVRDAARGR